MSQVTAPMKQEGGQDEHICGFLGGSREKIESLLWCFLDQDGGTEWNGTWWKIGPSVLGMNLVSWLSWDIRGLCDQWKQWKGTQLRLDNDGIYPALNLLQGVLGFGYHSFIQQGSVAWRIRPQNGVWVFHQNTNTKWSWPLSRMRRPP